ncbi:dockerin type I repeat-containing protein [bacterium]|nr:dockerin type I repeat-containing protein [bacterium]
MMQRHPSLKWKAILAAAALPAALFANQVVYDTSFEDSGSSGAEDYVAGTYNAPDTVGSWNLVAGTATVETGTTPDGSDQLVTLSQSAQFDRDFSSLITTPPADGIFIEGYFRGEGSSLTLSEATYPTDQSASAIVHFSSGNGIELFNGDGSGGLSSVVSANVPLGAGNASTWYKITVYLDFAAQTWDCYVDNAKKNASDLGFRDNVTTLNGFRNLSETATGFDAFRVVIPIRGDANGDASVDAADIVRLVEYVELGSSLDPILAFNADIDGDGSVGASDWQTLAMQIVEN